MTPSPTNHLFWAGVDISFFHGTQTVASLIIFKVSLTNIQTVYEGYNTHVEMTELSIAGFLAFRELELLLGLFCET